MRFRRAAQDDEEGDDDAEGIDDADLGAARAEVENRLHARMEQERQAGNNLTDEQLEAYIKERCVALPPTPTHHAAASRRAIAVRGRRVAARRRLHFAQP